MEVHMKNLFKIMICMGIFCGMPVLASEKSNVAGSVAPAQTDADAKQASELSATAGSSGKKAIPESTLDWRDDAFEAVYFGDAELLNKLLKQPGAAIDAVNNSGLTLLDYGCAIAYQQSKRHDLNGHDGRPYNLETFNILLSNKIDVSKAKGFIFEDARREKSTIKPLHCLYIMRAIFGASRSFYDDELQAEKLQLIINKMWKNVAANLDAYA